MKKLFLTTLLTLFTAGSAQAFCGFYVAKADSELFNQASKVVLVRDENRTIITMANDFEGDLTEFAIVVPVPTFLEEEQIHVTENKIIDHLDAYTAPRLVEYHDENPCMISYIDDSLAGSSMSRSQGARDLRKSGLDAYNLGVTIEAEYTVGEYDIQILSAKQSDGLAVWLTQNGYKIPDGAEDVLDSYIKQKTRFFVAKVNLEEKAKLGGSYLRPLQIAFESPKFMLPIRLGTVNAKDTQELFIFALTKQGRVETTNYRTVKIPTDEHVPLLVKGKFGDFYRAMFERAVEKERMKSVFLEYAWDMAWCDPCAVDPPSRDELSELGVFWLDEPRQKPTLRFVPPGQVHNVFVTRLHLRYNAENFPDDLKFHQTSDRSNFQGRYIMTHPWHGDDQCEAATQYRQSLPGRFEKEATTLAALTDWDVNDIREQMKENGQDAGDISQKPKDGKWWKRIWPE